MQTVLSVLAWWPGDEVNHPVLGLSVKAWGRIGKLMQYTGGLVALIDIVGEAKIRTAAQRLLAEWPFLLKVISRYWGARLFLYTGVVGVFGVLAAVGTWGLHRLLAGDGPAWVWWSVTIFFYFLAIAWALYSTLFSISCRLALLGLARISRTPANLKVIGFAILSVGFFLDLLAS